MDVASSLRDRLMLQLTSELFGLGADRRKILQLSCNQPLPTAEGASENDEKSVELRIGALYCIPTK